MNGRKSFSPPDFKLSETGEVVVAFSRLDVVDHDRDITRHGAIPIGKSVAMSSFGHGSWDGALPIGKGVLGESGDLGTFTGAFFMETDQGRNGYNTVKAMGEIQEWSYGFNILDSGPVNLNGTTVRELRKLDIHEVSPVLKGAGVSTSTLAIKSDAPGTDAPYAEYASWYLEHVPALIERSEDREAFRQAEGRTLSQKDRERLDAIASKFLEQHDAIRAFLSDPAAEAEERAKRALLVEIARAKSLGVL